MKQLVNEKPIIVDGYAIPVAVAFKVHARVEAFYGNGKGVPANAGVKPKPQPPKTATASHYVGNFRRLPPEVLKACKSIKYRAKKRKLDVARFVRNPDLCEKRTTLQLKLKPNVKDYLLKWSAKAKKDSSIRARFDMADLNKKHK